MTLRPSRSHPVVLPTAVLGLVLLAGLAVKVSCTAGDLTLGELWVPGCYSDVVAIFQARGLAADPVPYVDVTTEFPPLTALQWVIAQATTSTAIGFLLATAAMSGAAMLTLPWALARLGVARPWPLVLAPTVALAWLVSWDPVPVALLLGAVVAHRAGRDGLAGVLVGLGALAKVFPVLLAGPVLWALLARGDRQAAGRHLAGLVGTITLGLAVTAPWAGPGLWAMVEGNAQRPADWDTLWFGVFTLTGASPPVTAVNVVTTAAVLLGWAAIAWRGRGWSAPDRWALVLPVLVWLLLAGKVNSPQYSLWILPLMVVLVPDRRLVWAFVLTDAAVFLTRFPFLAGQEGLTPSLPYLPFGLAVLARALVLLAILARTTSRPPSPAHPE